MALIQHLRKLVAVDCPWPDGQLLEHLSHGADELSFTVLLNRHGPMVLRVCRNVLKHEQDAEDAFQATFLVLARHAKSIRKTAALAAWLHGVAYRTAMKAKQTAARRCRHEAAAGARAPKTTTEPTWGDVQAVLDEEVQRLAVPYRAAFVLCVLEGKSGSEAATALGIEEGTVSSRLTRARRLLQSRLTRRGIALGGVLAALSTATLEAALPVRLAETTTHGVMAVARGAAISGLVPAHVAALAAGVQRTMLATKAKIASALLLAVAAFSVAAFEIREVVCAAAVDEPAAQNAPESEKPAAAPPKAGPEPANVATQGDLPPGAVARLGSLAFNHGQEMSGMHFTPDGKKVVTTGSDIVRLWDAESGHELRSFSLPHYRSAGFFIESALRSDGKTLVHLDNEHQVTIVDVETEKTRRYVLANPGKSQRRIISTRLRNALSPNGELAATSSATAIGIHAIDDGRSLCEIVTKDAKFTAVTFAGNDRVVTGADDRSLEIWNAKTGKSLRRMNANAVAKYMVTSEDGQFLAFLTHDVATGDSFAADAISVWDLTKGEERHRFKNAAKGWFSNLRFARHSPKLFARQPTIGGERTSVWNVATGEKIAFPQGVFDFMAFSPDGSRFIADRMLWNAQTLKPIDPESVPGLYVFKMWLSHTGDRAVVVGNDSVSTWDTQTGRRQRVFGILPSFQALTAGLDRVISRYGQVAATYRPGESYFADRVVVWDVASGKELCSIKPDASQWQTTFSPDGRTVALWAANHAPGKKSAVELWNVATGQRTFQFAEPKATFASQLSYSSDGRRLVIYGGGVVGYDVATGQEQFSWKIPKLLPDLSGTQKVNAQTGEVFESSPVRGLALAPDAHLVACVQSSGSRKVPYDRTIALLDDRTGTVLFKWEYDGKLQWDWDRVEFSADARLLAVSDGDAAYVFETGTGKRLHTLVGHRNQVECLAFSGNGRKLATAARDWTIVIWDLDSKAKASKSDLDRCWADLLDDDASKAQAAVARLMDSPQDAARILSRNLTPATQAEQDALRQSIAKLEDDDFAKREEATQHLRKLGRNAVPALRAALSTPLPPESKRRVQSLLDAASTGPLTGESLRTWRALPVLEHSDDPECRRLLERLAGGASDAWLTDQARESLIRADLRAK